MTFIILRHGWLLHQCLFPLLEKEALTRKLKDESFRFFDNINQTFAKSNRWCRSNHKCKRLGVKRLGQDMVMHLKLILVKASTCRKSAGLTGQIIHKDKKSISGASSSQPTILVIVRLLTMDWTRVLRRDALGKIILATYDNTDIVAKSFKWCDRR